MNPIENYFASHQKSYRFSMLSDSIVAKTPIQEFAKSSKWTVHSRKKKKPLDLGRQRRGSNKQSSQIKSLLQRT